MTTYNVSEGALAIFQAMCSVLGMLGTSLVTYASERGIKVVAAARLFLMSQVASLWIACLCLWVNGWSGAFLAFVAVSRIGLWGFDVALLQLMQDGLGKSDSRATVSVIQYGLCDIFSVGITLAALLGSTDFQAMMQISLCCVTASFGIYQCWLWRTRERNR
jgi:iron-regulated transporter 1